MKTTKGRPAPSSLLAIVVVLISQFMGTVSTRAEITDLSPEKIQEFLDNNPGVDATDKFLENLPADFKNDWIMMTDSDSLQTGTATSPRFILPNPDSSRVFGFALNSQTIEYLYFDAAANKFHFRAIIMNGGGNGGKIDQVDNTSCNVCHASRRDGVRGTGPRPNWDAYDSWAGMLPFNRDRIYQFANGEESVEAKAIKRIFQALKDNPLYRQLVGPSGERLPNGITQNAGTGEVTIDFNNCDPGKPCKTDAGTGPVPVKYAEMRDPVTNELIGVSYPGTNGPISVRQGGKYVRLQATSKGADTDEGRGVALFDNFTNYNAMRVAHELADFPTDPVDIRYVALAIISGCVTYRTPGDNNLGRYARKEALNKLLAFQTNLDANVQTFTDLLDDTRSQMQSLPMLKANYEADNLKGLIEAKGDAFTAERVTANIARRSNEAFAVDTTNTLFMIDREKYGQVLKIALFRLYLEPLGVAVDTWSMSIRGRSKTHNTTYTFGDRFSDLPPTYVVAIETKLRAALGALTCSQLAARSIRQYAKYR